MVPSEALRNVLRALLVRQGSVLLIDDVEDEPLDFVTGLTQGCPASCILYGFNFILATPRIMDLSDESKRTSGFAWYRE